jgi:hypothetical protein
MAETFQRFVERKGDAVVEKLRQQRLPQAVAAAAAPAGGGAGAPAGGGSGTSTSGTPPAPSKPGVVKKVRFWVCLKQCIRRRRRPLCVFSMCAWVCVGVRRTIQST